MSESTRLVRRAFLLSAVLAFASSACTRVTAPQRADCTEPDFGRSILTLAAQAVPSATYLPCIASLPTGWSYAGADVRSGSAQFWLDSDRAGVHAVEVTLTRTCDVSEDVELPAASSTPPGVRAYANGSVLEPPYSGERRFVFGGGCLTLSTSLGDGASAALSSEAVSAVGFVPRSEVAQAVRRATGLTLCGANAPPCPG